MHSSECTVEARSPRTRRFDVLTERPPNYDYIDDRYLARMDIATNRSFPYHAAEETRSCEDLFVLAYLGHGHDLLPRSHGEHHSPE
jgi:hypothetical protein